MKHDYLGMDLYLTNKGKVNTTITKYIEGSIRDLIDKVTISEATHTLAHMFQVRPNTKHKILTMEQAHVFHRTIVKLVLISTRTRWYTDKSVELLTTRVKYFRADC